MGGGSGYSVSRAGNVKSNRVNWGKNEQPSKQKQNKPVEAGCYCYCSLKYFDKTSSEERKKLWGVMLVYVIFSSKE